MEDIRRARIREFRSQVESDPSNLSARWDLAVWCYRAAECEEAAAVLTDLIALDPRNSSAFALLGDVERSLSRLDEAEEHLRTALELNPNHHLALVALATCVRKKGKLAEADELLQRRISLSRF